MKLQTSIILLFWSFIAKLESSKIQKNAKPSVCNTKECAQSAQQILSFMDQAQDPCTDFYLHACGKFIATTPLPAYRTHYGIKDILARNALVAIEEILLNTDANNTAEVKSAQHMYEKCISKENNVNQLKRVVETLGGWRLTNSTVNTQEVSLDSLIAILIRVTGSKAIIGANIGVDLTNSTRRITHPYLYGCVKTNASKNAYIDYIKTCAQGLGADDTSKVDTEINEIIDFSNALANIIPDDGEAINYTLIYQKMTISELQQKTDPNVENFDWLNFYTALTSLELTSNETIGVYHLDYLIEAIQLVKSTNKTTVLNYVMWSFVDHYAWATGGELLESNLTTWKTLKGLSENVPRNTTCTRFVNSIWGFALAKPYVTKVFPSSALQEADEVIQSTLATFNEIVSSNISFLTGQAQAVALQKIVQLTVLVGYPDWVNNDTAVHEYFAGYSPMNSTHLLNSLNAADSQFQQQLDLLRKPVDKTAFQTLPSDVHAVNDLTSNTITYPAALLQLPDFGSIKALNYGFLGTLVGTELNKGLDFVGGQFGVNGDLDQWWTDSVIESVNKDVVCVTEQYNNYCSTDRKEICINGSATAIEHIGDYDGIAGAFNTYESWVSQNGPEQVLPGLTNYTGDQLLFVKFAQQYCSATIPQSIVEIYEHDKHLNNHYRVVGLLADFSQFATTFKCPVGPMNRGNASCMPF